MNYHRVTRRRRRRRHRRRNKKGIRKTNAGEELSVLTEGQLTSMYKATIQMSTQNKITSKNAFQLQLIDRINQVVDVVIEETKPLVSQMAHEVC